MSPVFEACHGDIDPQPYHERCIFDTCSCDQGGDCECLCTAIAVYAQVSCGKVESNLQTNEISCCQLKGIPQNLRRNVGSLVFLFCGEVNIYVQ